MKPHKPAVPVVSSVIRSAGLVTPARHKHWTKDEMTILENSHAIAKISVLASILGRTENAVRCKLKKRNTTKSRRFWTNKELAFLNNHIDRPLWWLSAELGRSEGSIQAKISVIKRTA